MPNKIITKEVMVKLTRKLFDLSHNILRRIIVRTRKTCPKMQMQAC
jgi:hypothetical protein